MVDRRESGHDGETQPTGIRTCQYQLPLWRFRCDEPSQRQRFTAQKTRLKSTLSSKHVITGK